MCFGGYGEQEMPVGCMAAWLYAGRRLELGKKCWGKDIFALPLSQAMFAASFR
jgi:hypothetical protein